MLVARNNSENIQIDTKGSFVQCSLPLTKIDTEATKFYERLDPLMNCFGQKGLDEITVERFGRLLLIIEQFTLQYNKADKNQELIYFDERKLYIKDYSSINLEIRYFYDKFDIVYSIDKFRKEDFHNQRHMYKNSLIQLLNSISMDTYQNQQISIDGSNPAERYGKNLLKEIQNYPQLIISFLSFNKYMSISLKEKQLLQNDLLKMKEMIYSKFFPLQNPLIDGGRSHSNDSDSVSTATDYVAPPSRPKSLDRSFASSVNHNSTKRSLSSNLSVTRDAYEMYHLHHSQSNDSGVFAQNEFDQTRDYSSFSYSSKPNSLPFITPERPLSLGNKVIRSSSLSVESLDSNSTIPPPFDSVNQSNTAGNNNMPFHSSSFDLNRSYYNEPKAGPSFNYLQQYELDDRSIQFEDDISDTISIGTINNKHKITIKKYEKNELKELMNLQKELIILKYLGNYPSLVTCYGYLLQDLSASSSSSQRSNRGKKSHRNKLSDDSSSILSLGNNHHHHNSKLQIIYEFSPYGNLSQLLKINKQKNIFISSFPLSLILSWLSDLADAMQFLHQKGMIHGDIKLENLFLFDHLQLKLGNFHAVKFISGMDHGIQDILQNASIPFTTHSSQHNKNNSSASITSDNYHNDIYCLSPEMILGNNSATLPPLSQSSEIDGMIENMNPLGLDFSGFLDVMIHLCTYNNVKFAKLQQKKKSVTGVAMVDPSAGDDLENLFLQIPDIISSLSISDVSIMKELEKLFLSCFLPSSSPFEGKTTDNNNSTESSSSSCSLSSSSSELDDNNHEDEEMPTPSESTKGITATKLVNSLQKILFSSFHGDPRKMLSNDSHPNQRDVFIIESLLPSILEERSSVSSLSSSYEKKKNSSKHLGHVSSKSNSSKSTTLSTKTLKLSSLSLDFLRYSLDTTIAQAEERLQLNNFFIQNLHFTSRQANQVTSILFNNGITNDKKLSSSLSKNSLEFFLNLGIELEILYDIYDYFYPPNQSENKIPFQQEPSSCSGFYDSHRQRNILNKKQDENEMTLIQSNPLVPKSIITFLQKQQQSSPSSSPSSTMKFYEKKILEAITLSSCYYYLSQAYSLEKHFLVTLEEAANQQQDILAKGYLMRLYALGQGQLIPKDRSIAELLGKEIIKFLQIEIQRNQQQQQRDHPLLVYYTYLLGVCYSEGLGIGMDKRESIRWYKMSADDGYSAAQAYLASCYFSGIGVTKNHSEAVRYYTMAAEQGYAGAQCNLGLCYEHGFGVEQDYRMAAKWYRLSADQGDAAGLYNLGLCYEKGMGVEHDWQEAFAHFHESAVRGYVAAQYSLGCCYCFGNGVEQDLVQAAKWLRAAAEKGFVSAQTQLGLCYENGHGVEQDFTEALYWYGLAAEKGDAAAQYYYGFCYFSGTGVEKNLEKAVEYYKLSSQKNYSPALNNLGFCYFNGMGVVKNYQVAVKYYKASADQGYGPAQYNMGYCYEKGFGVPKKLNMVIRYYRLAAQNGNKRAKNKLLKFC